MEGNNIQIFVEDVDIELDRGDVLIRQCLQLIEKEGCNCGFVNFILCSDKYLLELNRQYLQHDYYTDIITFDNSEDEGIVESDIFISIDRAKENALDHGVAFEKELERLFYHGLLHLTGYNDKEADDKKVMTERENYYLSLFA